MSYLFAAQWDGEAMIPLPRFRKECDKQFVIGEKYILETLEERSSASHRQYFASLRDSWMNLPEDISSDYPSEKHFRKKLLIKAGYFDETVIVFSSNKDAVKAAAMLYQADDYCVVLVSDRVLKKYVAKSQSLKAMGKDIFQESKATVLEIAASLIGTTPKTLSEQLT